jgi:hypothetical protein
MAGMSEHVLVVVILAGQLVAGILVMALAGRVLTKSSGDRKGRHQGQPAEEEPGI